MNKLLLRIRIWLRIQVFGDDSYCGHRPFCDTTETGNSCASYGCPAAPNIEPLDIAPSDLIEFLSR